MLVCSAQARGKERKTAGRRQGRKKPQFCLVLRTTDYTLGSAESRATTLLGSAESKPTTLLVIKAVAAAQASGLKAKCRSGWPCPGPLLAAEESSEGQLHPGTAARAESEPQPSASTGPPGYTVPAPAAARASPQPLHGSSRRRWGPWAPALQRGCVCPGHLAGALLLRPVLTL